MGSKGKEDQKKRSCSISLRSASREDCRGVAKWWGESASPWGKKQAGQDLRKGWASAAGAVRKQKGLRGAFPEKGKFNEGSVLGVRFKGALTKKDHGGEPGAGKGKKTSKKKKRRTPSGKNRRQGGVTLTFPGGKKAGEKRRSALLAKEGVRRPQIPGEKPRLKRAEQHVAQLRSI